MTSRTGELSSSQPTTKGDITIPLSLFVEWLNKGEALVSEEKGALDADMNSQPVPATTSEALERQLKIGMISGKMSVLGDLNRWLLDFPAVQADCADGAPARQRYMS